MLFHQKKAISPREDRQPLSDHTIALETEKVLGNEELLGLILTDNPS